MPSGLEILTALLTGGGDLRSVALGMALPQLPKIAKQLAEVSLPAAPAEAAAPAALPGATPGVAGAGIPPQLLPFLALASRAAQQPSGPMARPPVPPAAATPGMPRLAPMDITT